MFVLMMPLGKSSDFACDTSPSHCEGQVLFLRTLILYKFDMIDF